MGVCVCVCLSLSLPLPLSLSLSLSLSIHIYMRIYIYMYIHIYICIPYFFGIHCLMTASEVGAVPKLCPLKTLRSPGIYRDRFLILCDAIPRRNEIFALAVPWQGATNSSLKDCLKLREPVKMARRPLCSVPHCSWTLQVAEALGRAVLLLEATRIDGRSYDDGGRR